MVEAIVIGITAALWCHGVLVLLSLPGASTVLHEGASYARHTQASHEAATARDVLHLDRRPAWHTAIARTRLAWQQVQGHCSACDRAAGGIGKMAVISSVQAEAPTPTEGEMSDKPRVGQDQEVRVIVHLRMETGWCRDAPDTEPCQQAITQAREALLRELQGTRYQVMRVYATLPFMAFMVSPEALRLLQRSARVAGIEADTLSAPQEPPK
jgi:hypothetical protein